MNLLRKLIPDFLVQWDLYLLQNMPRLWATRIHYHLWFLLLLNIIAFGLGMVVTVNARRCPDPEELFVYMLVPVVAYFAFWVYRVVRFNVEKLFGVRKPYAEVGEFFVHLVSIVLIMTIPYTLSITVAWRMGVLTSDVEFAEEVNTLNEQAPWFYGLQDRWGYDDDYDYAYDDYEVEEEMMAREAVLAAEQAAQAAQAALTGQDLQALYNSVKQRDAQGSGTHQFFRNIEDYRHRFEEEEIVTSDVLPLHQLYTSYINNGNEALDPTDSAHYNSDTAAYYFAKADSIERNFPLLYIDRGVFTPSYFDHPPDSDSLREEAYIRRFIAKEPMDHVAIERALTIGSKYARHVHLIGADSVAAEFERRESSTTNLRACNAQMARISRAKCMCYGFMLWEAIGFGILLPCFILALLISIFKNNYWQPFLIAVVTGALIPVLVLVFALITEHSLFRMNDGDIMMYTHWWIGLSLLIVPFTIPSLKAYRTHRAVMVILANVVVPFFALFTLAILSSEFDVFGVQALQQVIYDIEAQNPFDLRLTELNHQLQLLNDHVGFVMMCTFWGGLVVYVFGLHPIFRNLYARMIALPEVR